MDKHVFISYQHEDNDFVEALIHRVEKVGRSHEAKQCYRKARELDYKSEVSLIG
jgi:hypothetical protein